jgi:hypothetical protein
VVPPTGETSNTLFEIFEEWNEQLKHVDFDELDRKSAKKNDIGEPQP